MAQVAESDSNQSGRRNCSAVKAASGFEAPWGLFSIIEAPMYGDKWRVGTVGYWPLRYSLWIVDKERCWDIRLQRDSRGNRQRVLCHAFINEDGSVEIGRGRGLGQRDDIAVEPEEMEPTARLNEDVGR